MKLKSLEDVLKEITIRCHRGRVPLYMKKFQIYIWYDSQDCKPLIGAINLEFTQSISEARILDILRRIDSITPICKFVFNQGALQYNVTKTEDFMKKPCGCYVE